MKTVRLTQGDMAKFSTITTIVIIADTIQYLLFAKHRAEGFSVPHADLIKDVLISFPFSKWKNEPRRSTELAAQGTGPAFKHKRWDPQSTLVTTPLPRLLSGPRLGSTNLRARGGH